METSEGSFSVPTNHLKTLILGYMYNTEMIGLELSGSPDCRPDDVPSVRCFFYFH